MRRQQVVFLQVHSVNGNGLPGDVLLPDLVTLRRVEPCKIALGAHKSAVNVRRPDIDYFFAARKKVDAMDWKTCTLGCLIYTHS